MTPIDFTTLKIASMPFSLASLQKTNTILQNDKEVIQNVLLVLLIGSAVVLGYKIYKEIKANEQIN
jgi:hypothetical protein